MQWIVLVCKVTFITFIVMFQFLTSPDPWPTKILLIISLEYTTESYKSHYEWSFLCMLQPYNVWTTVDKSLKRPNLQFIFLKHPWPFIQGLGHQNYNNNIEPEQGYNQARFERSPFQWCLRKGQPLFFNDEICQLSPLNACAGRIKWYVHDLIVMFNNPIMFHRNWVGT